MLTPPFTSHPTPSHQQVLLGCCLCKTHLKPVHVSAAAPQRPSSPAWANAVTSSLAFQRGLLPLAYSLSQNQICPFKRCLDHVTPLLKCFLWLPVCLRIKSESLARTYEVLCHLAPWSHSNRTALTVRLAHSAPATLASPFPSPSGMFLPQDLCTVCLLLQVHASRQCPHR